LYSVAAAGDKKSFPELNEKVLKFAKSHFRKQVGNGECWTLADQALAAANARRPGTNGMGPFVFGRELKPREKVLPGDIVQFTNVLFLFKRGGGAQTPQHTAIVSRVRGTQIEILHQNWNGIRRVGKFQLDRADLKKGKMAFFRPQQN
jgi:hypothetical protein